jgi:hypothetical protein
VWDPAYLKSVLSVLTAANPFTPLEVVFFDPAELPATQELLTDVRLRRPHFLDGDLRFLFPQPGNRAVLFTVVSGDRQPRFQGEMERQAYWWRRPALPSLEDLGEFSELDGVLIDSAVPPAEICAWQDRWEPAAEQYHISFAEVGLQRRWLLLTCPDEYVEKVMAWQSA